MPCFPVHLVVHTNQPAIHPFFFRSFGALLPLRTLSFAVQFRPRDIHIGGIVGVYSHRHHGLDYVVCTYTHWIIYICLLACCCCCFFFCSVSEDLTSYVKRMYIEAIGSWRNEEKKKLTNNVHVVHFSRHDLLSLTTARHVHVHR